jgi:hypothetical protein
MTVRVGWLVGGLLVSTGAWAQTVSPPAEPPPPDYGTSAIGVLIGTDTSFQGGPASFRFTISGEYDATGNDQFALAIAMPVTIVTQGDEVFGVSVDRTAFELPPSLRVRVMPDEVVRIYGDVGMGMVIVASRADDAWYLAQTDDVGFMTRMAIGLEFGPTHGPMFLLEPISTRTYWMGDTYGRIGVMAGFGGRF